jgi:hypothetical protein
MPYKDEKTIPCNGIYYDKIEYLQIQLSRRIPPELTVTITSAINETTTSDFSKYIMSTCRGLKKYAEIPSL